LILGVVAVAVGLTASVSMAGAGSESVNTDARYTPGRDFEPLEASSPCVGDALGQPFLLPDGYRQQVVAREGDGGALDFWDMNTQNEFGKDAGRYVFRTHELRPTGSQVTVTDLETGATVVLAQRADWEAFDGIVWTPWGTVLAAEEVTPDTNAVPDPDVPDADAGLVYELFVDRDDPTRLDPSREPPSTDDGNEDDVRDGIRARPALGSKAHEGMRFDGRGFHYGITEDDPGSIFRFVPAKDGDLSKGKLQALKTDNGHDRRGSWVTLDDEAARTDAQAAAGSKDANAYDRPEDVETARSTGRDAGRPTLFVALTGTDEVLAIDVSRGAGPFAYDYVYTDSHSSTSQDEPNAESGKFDFPDNLALDRAGNLAITEDPPMNQVGADIWIARPPQDGRSRKPASEVARFASLKDCLAEPTGIYFAASGTQRFTKGTALEGLVSGETLFVDRQHAGLGTALDELVAISPGDEAAGP